MKSPTGAMIHVFPHLDSLIEAAANALTDHVVRAVDGHEFYTLALSGGNTPQPLYRRLATGPYRDLAPWDRVKVFFADERAVPPTHPDSNWLMAWEAWLRDGPIPSRQIFRMEGEAGDLHEAAQRYSETLTHEVYSGPTGFPALDLVLLGLGQDGHTASLFPQTAALDETLRVVAANDVPQLGAKRLTLTYPAIDAAREVWFMVSGAAKARRVAQCLGFIAGGDNLPATLVRPLGGNLHWWLDAAAAAQLPQGV